MILSSVYILYYYKVIKNHQRGSVILLKVLKLRYVQQNCTPLLSLICIFAGWIR